MDRANINLDAPVACQEDVKKTATYKTGSVDPIMLKTLRTSLSESLTVFGFTLRRAIDPYAKDGYSRQYISRLEHGRDAITTEIAAAYWNIVAIQDDVPAAVGGAVTVQILAQPGQLTPGTLIKRSPTMHSKHCHRPGCPVIFAGPGLYHDPDCQKAHYREVRKRKGRT